jgi:Tfp pilus assembly protein PilO
MDAVQEKRVWLGGGALSAVVVAAAGWFALISPELSSTSSLREQTDAAQQQNTVLQAKTARLKKQSDNLTALTATLRNAVDALPLDSGLPEFTRQVSAQAKATKVTLSGISVGTIGPAAMGAATPAAAAAAAGAADAGAAGKLYSIPITMIVNGSYAHELRFLKEVQATGPRRALVTSTQFAPGASSQVASVDGSATMTVQLTIFAAPRSPQAAAQLAKQLIGQPAG